MVFAISSPSFKHGEAIPPIHTRCDGQDLSPPLQWSDVPDGTKSLVLTVDDPDAPNPAAPKMTWVHWVVYNIPPTTTRLEPGAKDLPPTSKVALNDWKQHGYGGPSPPIGRHRYFHKLYALDAVLPDLGATANMSSVTIAMKGKIIAQCEIMGTYQKR